MRYARYSIILVVWCIGMLLSVPGAAAQTGYGSSAGKTASKASPDNSAAIQLKIQSLEAEIRQMQDNLRPMQSQLNMAASRQNSLMSHKPMSPQGNDRNSWQAYDNASKKWQTQLSQSQNDVNRIRKMISDRQIEIQAKQDELQQVKISAGLEPRDSEYEVPSPAGRLPGSTIPGDPRGMMDD